MKMNDFISQFTKDLTFEALMDWADILKVGFDEAMWPKDKWIEHEDRLRALVAEAIRKVGK